MRLLTPSDIQQVKQKEKKIEIDEGMKLAKKIDALRITFLEEQQKLQNFRENNVLVVQKELDSLIDKVADLKSQIEYLEAKKLELQKPLDEEWKRVEKLKDDTLNLRKELQEKESSLDKQQNSIDIKNKSIDNQNKRLSEIIEKNTITLQESEKIKRDNLTESNRLKSQIENNRIEHERKISLIDKKEQRLNNDIKHYQDFEETLRKKERELSLRERRLTIRENASTK